MKNHLSYLISAGCCLLLSVSCAKKQDFTQYEDLEITPTAEASLLYVEAPESMINEAQAGVYYTEDFNFDAFAEDFVSDNVLDGVVTYQLENTSSKELEITVEFLDDLGNVLDTEQFHMDPAPTAILDREIAYGGASGRPLDILRNTSGIRVTGRNLGDSTSVSTLPDPKIILRSSAKIRIRLK